MRKFLMLLLLSLSAVPRAQAKDAGAGQTTHKSYMVFKADLKWGAGGPEEGMFLNPNGLWVDSSDDIYVLDNGNDRVQKFDGEGKFIASYRHFEQTDPDYPDFKISDMRSVCADKDGNLFFRGDSQVFAYDADKKVIFKGQPNTYDTAGYFLSRDGYLYFLTSDGGGNILKITRGGKLVLEYPDKVDNPAGVVVDSRGNIYALNGKYGRDCAVQKYESNGDYVLRWGKSGERDGEFQGISGWAIDGEDHIYVLDGSMDRVQAFTPDGKLWTKWGRRGIGLGEMRDPRAIGVNSKGQVYVLDSGNNRVQRFTRYRVDVTLDADGEVVKKTETPLTDTLPNTQVDYAPGSDMPASRDDAAPQAIDPKTRNELKTRDGGAAGAVEQKGQDAIGNAAGDAAKKLLGF